MNMMDIARNIDRRPENESWVDISDVARDLGIPDFFGDDEQERLKAYWIGRWYCTDSHVGWRMYFFDGEPVAYSEQIGRKYDEEFKWFSLEAADKVKDYVESLMVIERHEVALCDPEKDVGDSFKIDYTSEVMDWDRARYEGHLVEVVEIEKEPNDYYGFHAKVHIHVPETGADLVVGVRDLDFAFFLERDFERTKESGKESLEDKIKAAEGSRFECVGAGKVPEVVR